MKEYSEISGALMTRYDESTPQVWRVPLRDQVVPGTINLNDPDPACDLDYTADGTKHADFEYAMSNNFGFGGTNSSLIFKRWDA